MEDTIDKIVKEEIFSKDNLQNLNSVAIRLNYLIVNSDKEGFCLGEILTLGRLIREFAENPIVKTSGIITIKQ